MQLIKDLLSLLVHQGCYACGRQLASQEHIVCFNCLGHIQQTDFHLAPKENELYYRLAGRVELGGATGLFYFDKKGKLQRLINAFKYQDAPDVAVHLGRLLGHSLKDSEMAGEFDAVIPVPLHPAKALKRGYNQAERIAFGLAEALGKDLDTACLLRSRNTRTQTRKSRDARWRNVNGAFELKKQPPSRLLLVDDVITTGATLEACIQVLQAADITPEYVAIGCVGLARG
ncbi:MAG: ComF family protein [Bacteroidia bacterium]